MPVWHGHLARVRNQNWGLLTEARRSNKQSLNRSMARWLNRSRRQLLREEAVVIQIAIDAAGNLCSLGAEGGAASSQEHDHDNAAMVGVRIRREPAKTRASFRTGPRLSQYLLFAEV